VKRSLVMLALLSLLLLALSYGGFGQSIVCLQYESEADCSAHSSLCSWCISKQQCLPSTWPCTACEDVPYIHCGGVSYPGCKTCALTHSCTDVGKPCYCGNGELNCGEECDGTPHCDPVYCTCGEGHIKDPNHPPYCCCDDCVCNGLLSTDASVCSGHGLCMGDDECLCLEGWTGPYCSIAPGSADSDQDGICDGDDLCPGTTFGANVDENGCSGEQHVDSACPCNSEWKNHGEYVSCVVRNAQYPVEAGLMMLSDIGAIISDRARSDCGKKN